MDINELHTPEQKEAIDNFYHNRKIFFESLTHLREAFEVPALDIAKQDPDEAINWLYRQMPDSSARVMLIHNIMDIYSD